MKGNRCTFAKIKKKYIYNKNWYKLHITCILHNIITHKPSPKKEKYPKIINESNGVKF